MMYVQFIDYYLMFGYSIRSGDFEIYMYVLLKFSNLFFTFNQQNYTRYLVKYHDNLLKVDETHPGLEENLKKGIGIKRTPKTFPRSLLI